MTDLNISQNSSAEGASLQIIEWSQSSNVFTPTSSPSYLKGLTMLRKGKSHDDMSPIFPHILATKLTGPRSSTPLPNMGMDTKPIEHDQQDDSDSQFSDILVPISHFLQPTQTQLTNNNSINAKCKMKCEQEGTGHAAGLCSDGHNAAHKNDKKDNKDLHGPTSDQESKTLCISEQTQELNASADKNLYTEEMNEECTDNLDSQETLLILPTPTLNNEKGMSESGKIIEHNVQIATESSPAGFPEDPAQTDKCDVYQRDTEPHPNDQRTLPLLPGSNPLTTVVSDALPTDVSSSILAQSSVSLPRPLEGILGKRLATDTDQELSQAKKKKKRKSVHWHDTVDSMDKDNTSMVSSQSKDTTSTVSSETSETPFRLVKRHEQECRMLEKVELQLEKAGSILKTTGLKGKDVVLRVMKPFRPLLDQIHKTQVRESGTILNHLKKDNATKDEKKDLYRQFKYLKVRQKKLMEIYKTVKGLTTSMAPLTEKSTPALSTDGETNDSNALHQSPEIQPVVDDKISPWPPKVPNADQVINNKSWSVVSHQMSPTSCKIKIERSSELSVTGGTKDLDISPPSFSLSGDGSIPDVTDILHCGSSTGSDCVITEIEKPTTSSDESAKNNQQKVELLNLKTSVDKAGNTDGKKLKPKGNFVAPFKCTSLVAREVSQQIENRNLSEGVSLTASPVSATISKSLPKTAAVVIFSNTGVKSLPVSQGFLSPAAVRMKAPSIADSSPELRPAGRSQARSVPKTRDLLKSITQASFSQDQSYPWLLTGPAYSLSSAKHNSSTSKLLCQTDQPNSVFHASQPARVAHLNSSQPDGRSKPEATYPSSKPKYPTLKEMIDSGVIEPGDKVISLETPTQRFEASLTPQGYIRSAGGEMFLTPTRWCVALLSSSLHPSSIKKLTAYQKVMYKGIPLTKIKCPPAVQVSTPLPSYQPLPELTRTNMTSYPKENSMAETVIIPVSISPQQPVCGKELISNEIERSSPSASLYKILACCTKVNLIRDEEFLPLACVFPADKWSSALHRNDIPQSLIDEIDNW